MILMKPKRLLFFQPNTALSHLFSEFEWVSPFVNVQKHWREMIDSSSLLAMTVISAARQRSASEYLSLVAKVHFFISG